MPSSYYKPCKELDRCLELNKYWDTDKKKWFEGYYKIANETHYPLSECQLGYCYLEGIGTEKNIFKAVEWTSLSAKHGDRDAQYNLGCFYEDGIGLEKDIMLALYWYRKAAKQEHDLAKDKCKALFSLDTIVGERIVLRKGVESDYESMFKNVWNDVDIYNWMYFKPANTIEEAVEKNKKTISFQHKLFAYYIALKDTNEAIGLCGIYEYEDGRFQECGICVGKEYQGKGIGKEVVSILLDFAFNKLHAKDFRYAYYMNNIKSEKLAIYFGFEYGHTEEAIRPWDQKKLTVNYCYLTKEKYKERT